MFLVLSVQFEGGYKKHGIYCENVRNISIIRYYIIIYILLLGSLEEKLCSMENRGTSLNTYFSKDIVSHVID